MRDRRGEVLFIDARNLGFMVDRTRKEFSDADITRIADNRCEYACRFGHYIDVYDISRAVEDGATLARLA